MSELSEENKKEMEIKGYHTYIKILEEKYIIPYGKSKFLQFLYIYNPYLYFKSCYKWKSHIEICKYNCNWISVVRFYCKFKKNRDINKKDILDQRKKVKLKLF